jgi:copper chaperone NosL
MQRFVGVINFIFLLFFSSCSVEPQPINYGADACHYCKMNIVDSQHAAEFVTEKGKVYKFDAIECMLRQIKSGDQTTIALYLVNNYDNPGDLSSALLSTYLISEAIPSPMGAFLSGFTSNEAALSTKEELGGELYTWDELKSKYGQ